MGREDSWDRVAITRCKRFPGKLCGRMTDVVLGDLG